MSLPIVVSPKAIDDIRETARYLAQDSQASAEHFEQDLIECILRLSIYPGMGLRVRNRPVIRRFRVSERFRNWFVFHMVRSDDVLRVVRVLHGARNVAAILHDSK